MDSMTTPREITNICNVFHYFLTFVTNQMTTWHTPSIHFSVNQLVSAACAINDASFVSSAMFVWWHGWSFIHGGIIFALLN